MIWNKIKQFYHKHSLGIKCLIGAIAIMSCIVGVECCKTYAYTYNEETETYDSDNLVYFNNETYNTRGIDISVFNNTIHIEGTCNQTFEFWRILPSVINTDGGYYTMYFNPMTLDNNGAFPSFALNKARYDYSNYIKVSGAQTTSDLYNTKALNFELTYYYFVCYTGTYYNCTFNVMLTKGNTPMKYEPYGQKLVTEQKYEDLQDMYNYQVGSNLSQVGSLFQNAKYYKDPTSGYVLIDEWNMYQGRIVFGTLEYHNRVRIQFEPYNYSSVKISIVSSNIPVDNFTLHFYPFNLVTNDYFYDNGVKVGFDYVLPSGDDKTTVIDLSNYMNVFINRYNISSAEYVYLKDIEAFYESDDFDLYEAHISLSASNDDSVTLRQYYESEIKSIKEKYQNDLQQAKNESYDNGYQQGASSVATAGYQEGYTRLDICREDQKCLPIIQQTDKHLFGLLPQHLLNHLEIFLMLIF